ncbi:hypothetical protein B566_EDAN016925 [Ephemera danica]|nr:hypothetical protein B566_EDAN016925 [Ephemera danica]
MTIAILRTDSISGLDLLLVCGVLCDVTTEQTTDGTRHAFEMARRHAALNLARELQFLTGARGNIKSVQQQRCGSYSCCSACFSCHT